jgi:hypothetical protein
MWNGTRQVPPSPVPMVAVRWLTRTTTPVMPRPSRSSKVTVSPCWNSRAGFWPLLAPAAARRRLLAAALGLGVALHRDAGDLPGSFGALLQHRGLGVLEGDDLAAAHLTVAEVDEAHGLPQVQAGARGQAARGSASRPSMMALSW